MRVIYVEGVRLRRLSPGLPRGQTQPAPEVLPPDARPVVQRPLASRFAPPMYISNTQRAPQVSFGDTFFDKR